MIFPDIPSHFGCHFGVSFGTFSQKTGVLQVLFSVLFHRHIFSWFLVRFMVSGTLKIHQNQWRVVQNQGSLKNVKVASEVAFRVNFDPILEPCWLPKCIFLQKRSSWKSVQKKEPPQVSNGFGATQRRNRMAPGKPPLAHALFQTKTIV